MEPHQLDNYLFKARQIAVRFRNEFVTREHFLMAIMSEREIMSAFSDLNVPIPFVRECLEKYFKDNAEKEESTVGEDDFGKLTDSLQGFLSQVLINALGARRAFPRAIDFVIELLAEKDTYVRVLFDTLHVSKLQVMEWATEHPSKNKASEDLNGITFHEFILSDRDQDEEDEDLEDEDDGDDEDSGEDGEDESDDGHRVPTGFRRLSSFLTRLVEKARRGEIDPVVGRDVEIETCCLALLRRTKSNILIVGEAGVGKTAIVDGLARAIARKEVPTPLQDMEIYALDIPAMMAGTKLRGEMEGRLKSVVRFIEKHPSSVLFIDELHSAVGTERNGGSQEILSFLKPQLANGSIRLIGTTTYEDYRRSIANDTALLRRFHKLDVVEPDESTTRLILEALTPHYASYHDVEYTDEALNAAVQLSGRHMPERRFPDKAIDIIDEVGAMNRMMRDKNTELQKVIHVEDVEKIVAKMARIPDLHVSENESESLRSAEKRMKEVVFGQDHAIETLVRLVKLSRAGIRATQKPVANILFAGPTGVGKTEVARQLALALGIPFVRFDMSEYREEYSVSKFIGSAPGYVGFERGGLLTEAIRSKPNCVLLLDEIEKAHSAIFDLLLQVMDAATLTDNTGKTADFRNVILLMTSNSGSEDMSRMSIGFDRKIDVMNGFKDIEKTFSPEFRNRLDEIILFNALSSDSMKRIVERMVRELSESLRERHVCIEISDKAKSWFAKEGYEPQFGARPMARLIQKEISIPLSDEILFGVLKEGGTACVDWDENKGKITLRCTKAQE